MTKPTYEELEHKTAQAYQVLGWLLSECGLFHTKEGQDALTYFTRDVYSDDFLPWPKDAQRLMAKARKAFEAAAKEADILMPAPSKPAAPAGSKTPKR